MSETLSKKETSRELEIAVEFINASGKPEQKRFMFTSEEGSQVKAGDLKQGFLHHFDETSAILEPEEETDENRSYHLLGLDQSGKRTAFADTDTIDLNSYTRFQISPRTMGGGRALIL